MFEVTLVLGFMFFHLLGLLDVYSSVGKLDDG